MSQPVWYLLHEGTQHGPLSDAELHALAANGSLLHDDLIWKPGFEQWQPANTIPNLLTPPPPPKAPEPRSSEPVTAAASSAASATPSRIGIGWILLACLGIFLVVLSEGMMKNPNELDSNLGLGVRMVATALIFALLHWRKGWFPKNPHGSVRTLAWMLILFGSWEVASFVFLLWLVADTPLGPWLVLFTIAGVALAVVGTALLMRKNWARMAGNVLVFAVAFGWPTGFALACYAWWVLARPAPVSS